ncbi:MAG: helix-turn-helix transcriptional regulator [Rudaea sp.]|uniref:HTH araC/xylS-type domain-containing protein n=1 Tax=marine sediment metagenome TaxID=412755 RepID=X1FMA2_9ZZZZ|nr:helix-turn-helix transcriptional regulator [Rudaea sp.]
MNDRPGSYPLPAPSSMAGPGGLRAPLLDTLTVPVPGGAFDPPLDHRHVLCIHLGGPVPVSHRADGRDNRGVRLHGQICVSPTGSTTRWILSRPARSLLLRLTPALIGDTAEAMGVALADADLAPSAHVRDPQIERIAWMMQAEGRDNYPGGRLFADGLACALAARLLARQARRGAQAPDDDGPALPPWRLQRVLDYVDAHLDEDLSLAELAAVAGFSVSHFKPLFRRAVGMPAHRFVLERRVDRARSLLLDSRKSMTEIALESGFAHASHMARCMRRVLGCSPAQIVQAR